MIRIVLCFALLAVSGCSFLERGGVDVFQPGEDNLRPKARLDGAGNAPPLSARTAEDFDTTSTQERDAAVASSTSGTARLGRTIASLGAVTEPGFWLKTPLVDMPRTGRVELPSTGTFVNVDLIPLEGPASGGSQLSLAAMRLLDVALTDLPEIVVYTR